MLMDIGLMEDDFAPVNGVRIIQDMKGITLAHMGPPTVTKKAMTIFQEAYPNRIKGLHFVNTPGFFDMIFGLFRPFLTEKMKNRVSIFYHQIFCTYFEIHYNIQGDYILQKKNNNGILIMESILFLICKINKTFYTVGRGAVWTNYPYFLALFAGCLCC